MNDYHIIVVINFTNAAKEASRKWSKVRVILARMREPTCTYLLLYYIINRDITYLSIGFVIN